MSEPLSPEHKALAKGLKPGAKIRVDHCGGGKAALLSHNDNGYSLHCFRCGEGGWSPKDLEPLNVRLERLRRHGAADAEAQASAMLPEQGVFKYGDWPSAARLWLLKAGLSAHDVGRLGAYYHPPTNRVVLPVLARSGGGLEYWQARSIDGRMPKYLGSPVGRHSCVPMYGNANEVTLTEDILSAYKVGTVAEGWCLLGTSVNSTCWRMLIERGDPVNVWLDPDKPGRRAAFKAIAKLRNYGIEVRNILSTKDPKLLHREQIKEILCSSK